MMVLLRVVGLPVDPVWLPCIDAALVKRTHDRSGASHQPRSRQNRRQPMTLEGVTMSTTRIQLALNVEDVSAATAFYEKMFGVPPHKVREGYANSRSRTRR